MADETDAEPPATVGAEILACANYQAFQDSIDKFAHQNGFGDDVARIRDAVGHAVDHGVAAAASEYDLPEPTVEHVLEWLDRAAAKQYAEQYDPRT